MNEKQENEWADRLSPYLDDELEPEDRAAVERRLEADAELRAVLEELRRVKELASELPDRAPEADLWPGIAERIAASADSGIVPLRPSGHDASSRFSFSAMQLAAAGIVMLLFGSGLTFALQRAGGPEPGASSVATVPAAGAQAAAPVASAPNQTRFAAATVKYDAAIRELELGLATGRAKLDPETLRVLEASLAKIDLAIQEARAALVADPASAYLSRHLTGAMTRKLDVLQRANELVRAQT